MTGNKHIKFYKYYDQWVDIYKLGQVRSATINKYHVVAKQIKKLAPDLYLDEITRADVQLLINNYGQTHEISTVREFVNHLKAPLQDAVYEGWIQRDPTYKVKAMSMVKNHSTRRKYIQPDQIERLVEVFKERNDVPSLMFDFDLRTALRLAELLGLTPNDVDLDEMTITVNKSWNYKARKMGFQPCKNKYSNRVLAIDQRAANDLKKAMKGCSAGEPIFVRALSLEEKKNAGQRGRRKGKDYGNRYARVYDAMLNRELASDCKKAHVPRISIHSLRHIHGSMLISQGVSIESVSKRLGHANTITTQQTYIHVLDDLKTKDDKQMMNVLSKLGDSVKSKPAPTAA